MELFVEFRPGKSEVTNRLSQHALERAIVFASAQGLKIHRNERPARGSYSAVIDGKSLISEKFLYNAVARMKPSKGLAICYPEFRVLKDDNKIYIARYPGKDEPEIVSDLLIGDIEFPQSFVCASDVLQNLNGPWQRSAWLNRVSFLEVPGAAEFSLMERSELLTPFSSLKGGGTPVSLNISKESLKELFRELLRVESIDVRMSVGASPVHNNSFLKTEIKPHVKFAKDFLMRSVGHCEAVVILPVRLLRSHVTTIRKFVCNQKCVFIASQSSHHRVLLREGVKGEFFDLEKFRLLYPKIKLDFFLEYLISLLQPQTVYQLRENLAWQALRNLANSSLPKQIKIIRIEEGDAFPSQSWAKHFSPNLIEKSQIYLGVKDPALKKLCSAYDKEIGVI